MKIKDKYDYVVVGSGVGGGTLTKGLTDQGKDVLCIEWGSPLKKVGSFWDAPNYYDFQRIPFTSALPQMWQKIPLRNLRTKEGVILWRAICAGGSSVISLGNGTRCLEQELKSIGVDLSQEFEETEKEVGLTLVTERLLSKGSRTLRDAAKTLGYDLQPMPKFVNPAKCVKCHQCIYGCTHNAKWDTRPLLCEAEQNGAHILYDSKVSTVEIDNNKATGVTGTIKGKPFSVKANNVILAAGGMATPVILQKSGISEAGPGFFLDLMWTTFGITKEKGLNQDREINMALVGLDWHNNGGFLLSPFMVHNRLSRLTDTRIKDSFSAPSKNMLGMMTKITDESNGNVSADGTFSKPITARDWQRLKQGAKISREILVEAGADPQSLFETKVGGAHPGGTAAIGKVVDVNLKTKVDGLYVCDASVLPGEQFNDRDRLPPILTLIALSKRLTKHLTA